MKNTAEMRSFLVDQIAKVANGEQAAKDAKAICNYAQQVYNTLNIEIKLSAAEAKTPSFKRKFIPFD